MRFEMDDQKLLASCGTNCGVCSFLIAYKTNDEKLKERLAKMIKIQPEEIICEGCNSDNVLITCQYCRIKRCVKKKGQIDSCVDCEEFPCRIIEKFPVQEFIKRVKWDVNYRRKNGKAKWIEKTIEMNTCSSCQALTHWRGRTCKSCGNEFQERYG